MGLPIVLIHCQYVYGLGHLVRALQLAKGLLSDFEVYFLSGGESVDGISINDNINFIQLDALYKEEGSNQLSSVDESVTTVDCLKNREKLINKLIEDICPDVVVTEHFPFGFLFEKEVLNLISKAKRTNNKVKIVCSVRDIIETRKERESDQKTVKILNEYFDLLLIHGDENLIPLDISFSLSNKIHIRQISTGYIVDNCLKRGKDRKETIVVSVAGGRVGRELKVAVIQAFKAIQNKVNHKLLVFDGAFKSHSEQNIEGKDIQLIKFDRSIFLKELSQSDISISLGGYNTTVESLFVGNKVIVYNREFLGKNFEQDIRISSLAELGYVKTINAEHLEQNKLSNILLEQVRSPLKTYANYLNFGGVTKSVIEIKQLING